MEENNNGNVSDKHDEKTKESNEFSIFCDEESNSNADNENVVQSNLFERDEVRDGLHKCDEDTRNSSVSSSEEGYLFYPYRSGKSRSMCPLKWRRYSSECDFDNDDDDKVAGCSVAQPVHKLKAEEKEKMDYGKKEQGDEDVYKGYKKEAGAPVSLKRKSDDDEILPPLKKPKLDK